MTDRFHTSFEALCEGLSQNDADAQRASMDILQLAHDRSRSQLVLFVGELPLSLMAPLLQQWFDGPWETQTAAWWVCAYVERVATPKSANLRQMLALLQRLPQATDHDAVTIQALGWLYNVASVSPKALEASREELHDSLDAWLNAENVYLALAALQTMLRMNIPVAKTAAAKVVARGAARGIPEADVLGMRCGFIESAERLVQEIFQRGPFTWHAVKALVEALPETADKKLRAYRVPWWSTGDTVIHVSTILAAHGDEDALQRLEKWLALKDLRRRGLAWSSLILALQKRDNTAALDALGKRLLREPESVRAWVLSELSPACPVQRAWLDQAKRFGTLDEQEAVVDAMRAFSLREPLVPDP